MSQTIDVLTGSVIKKPPHATSAYPLFYQHQPQPRKLFEPISDHPQFRTMSEHHYDRGFWDGFDAGPISVIENPPVNNRSARFFADKQAATKFLYPTHRQKFIKSEADNLFKPQYMHKHNNIREVDVGGKKFLFRKSKENTGRLFAP